MQPSMIIIGGGINGSAIARDAAMRGVHVFLFEKSDFGGGTSWASSKLIHGGLRYLEHGELGLVRESLRERKILHELHDPNIHPIELIIPVSRSYRRPLWQIRAGMALYDLLSWNKHLPSHRTLDKKALVELEKNFGRRDMIGGVGYFDCQCDYPERLVVSNLHSAVAHGARVYNYHEITQILITRGRANGVVVRDRLTGRTFEQQADVVVNAAGPWLDELIKHQSAKRLIGGTRGSHLVIENRGHLSVGIYSEAVSDGRPFFIIPWLDFILVGSTDVRHEQSPDEAVPTRDEINYLISEFRHVLPRWELSRDHILFSFAGVRPLPYAEGKEEGAITRRHHVIRHSRRDRVQGLFSLVGGKLTTYRSTADDVLRIVARECRWHLPACQTHLPEKAGAPIPPDVPSEVRRHLTALYGVRVPDVFRTSQNLSPVEAGRRDVWVEVDYAMQNEWVRNLSDLIFRRTALGYARDAGLGVIDAVGDRIQAAMKWSEAELIRQKSDVRNFIRHRLRSHLDDSENQQ